jgi:hypothetical protein
VRDDLMIPHQGRVIRRKEPSEFISQVGTSKCSIVTSSFAVLVGGTMTNLWIQVVLVVRDDEMEADLQRLRRASDAQEYYATTKGHLLSVLEQDPAKWPTPYPREMYSKCKVMFWNWSYRCFRRVEPRQSTSVLKRLVTSGEPVTEWQEKTSTGPRGLLVDAHFQKVASNLAEHNVVLFIEIIGEGKEFEDRGRRPEWWNFQHVTKAILEKS